MADSVFVGALNSSAMADHKSNKPSGATSDAMNRTKGGLEQVSMSNKDRVAKNFTVLPAGVNAGTSGSKGE